VVDVCWEVSLVASGAVASSGAMQARVSDPRRLEESCAVLATAVICVGGAERASIVVSVRGMNTIQTQHSCSQSQSGQCPGCATCDVSHTQALQATQSLFNSHLVRHMHN
jgi:hypothetical protein